jgi:hypothetical protein
MNYLQLIIYAKDSFYMPEYREESCSFYTDVITDEFGIKTTEYILTIYLGRGAQYTSYIMIEVPGAEGVFMTSGKVYKRRAFILCDRATVHVIWYKSENTLLPISSKNNSIYLFDKPTILWPNIPNFEILWNTRTYTYDYGHNHLDMYITRPVYNSLYSRYQKIIRADWSIAELVYIDTDEKIIARKIRLSKIPPDVYILFK